MAIHTHSASSLLKMMNEKTLSATEVAQAFLDRITDVNPVINAIHQVYPEKILQQAKDADEKRAKGKRLGKLHGLPISIKNTANVKGFEINKGCPLLANNISPTNATVVNRLLHEGAIILGITNVPELLASYESDNLLYGRTNNPHDISRTAGGSSGGEAALIAAGGSPLGLGSDGGGSIRQPAHCTGITGIKPTQHLIPITGTVPSDAIGLVSHILSFGPMSRYVEDLILTLPILAGPDGIDPYAVPVKLGNPDKVNVKKLKIAYFYEDNMNKSSDETVKTILHAAETLKDIGCRVEEKTPPDLKNIYNLLWETLIFCGDGGKFVQEILNSATPFKLSPLFQKALSRAKACSFDTLELKKRLAQIDTFRIGMMNYMRNHDVLICPVGPTPAPLHGTTHDNFGQYTYPMLFNLTGWPATTIRFGTSKEGLPIGIQIAAKPWNDHISLAVAQRLQHAFGVSGIPKI